MFKIIQVSICVIVCGFIIEAVKGQTKQCAKHQWQCLDGTCIFLIGRCDNYPDCTDRSDEYGCNFDVCSEGLRRCSSGECIEQNKFCDGNVHCLDASDELAADCSNEVSNSSLTRSQTNEVSTLHNSTTLISPLSTRLPANNVSPSLPGDPVVSAQENNAFYPPINTTTKPFDNAKRIIPFIPTERIQQVSASDRQMKKSMSEPVAYQWTSFPDKSQYSVPTVVNPYPPTTSKNPCVINEESHDFCRGRYRGYFKHPNDCTQYIVCEWGFMYVCKCPEKTHWDVRFLTCIWDYTAPCDNSNPVPPLMRMEYTTPQLIAKETTTQRSTTETILVPPEPRLRSVAINPIRQPNFLTKFNTIEVLKQPRPPLRAEQSTSQFVRKTSRRAEKEPINNEQIMNSVTVPPQMRLRDLPVTPAWLKNLSDQSALLKRDRQSPQYKSLLTRFFKAVPVEVLEKPPNQALRMVK
ncbi:hypothetical protein ACF0H5_000105 [Mactra antiquata]